MELPKKIDRLPISNNELYEETPLEVVTILTPGGSRSKDMTQGLPE